MMYVSATLLIHSRIASLTASRSSATAAGDGEDLGPHRSHAEDVEFLAANILHPCNAAWQLEQCRGSGTGDAMHAGTGLRDDPRLAHTFGQQCLTESVIDLVCRWAQVFAKPERCERRRAESIAPRSRAGWGG